MFTINIYLRFALIALGIVGGITLWAVWGFWYGFPLLLLGIILLAGYLMLGTIMSTNQLIMQQDYPAAEERLKLTYFPNIMLMGYKGVYYMTKGALAMHRKDMGAAETLLKQALGAGLPSDNERGAALLQLAMIYGSKNNRQGAQHQINEMKKLNITESMIKDQAKELEKQLKQLQQAGNPSMISMMGGRGGYRPGGKRPRPKMR